MTTKRGASVMCLHHSKDPAPRKLQRGSQIPAFSPKTYLLLTVAALEADAIISTWPACPPLASRRVDRLTIRTDRLMGREVAL